MSDDKRRGSAHPVWSILKKEECKDERLQNVYEQIYDHILKVRNKLGEADSRKLFEMMNWHSNVTFSVFNAILHPEKVNDVSKEEHEAPENVEMTRDEMMQFIDKNPFVKVTHRFFDDDEYIYQMNGVVYDEYDYLFEDWGTYGEEDEHDGLRRRAGGEWETGWSLYNEKGK